jgi:hypothetical protein
VCCEACYEACYEARYVAIYECFMPFVMWGVFDMFVVSNIIPILNINFKSQFKNLFIKN